MVIPSRYWTIWRFEAIEGGQIRTRGRKCDRAEAFFQQQFPQFSRLKQLSHTQEREIQSHLLSAFRTPVPDSEEHRAIAGLCLRCYVSYDILRACHQLAFRYRDVNSQSLLEDLLPFALIDRAETLILPIADCKEYVIFNPNPPSDKSPKIESIAKILALKVLEDYQPDGRSKNLKNWTYLIVRQDKFVRDTLLNYSINLSSPWSLLKKADFKKLANFSERDRRVIESFQAVYRRDRRNHLRGNPCPAPSQEQLSEVLSLLQAGRIAIDTTRILFDELKQIADRLRQAEIWSKTKNPSSKQIVPLETDSEDALDLLDSIIDETTIFDADCQEQQELLAFLYEQLATALKLGIQSGIEDRTIELSRSKGYKTFASNYTIGLSLMYIQNLSQTQIAKEFDLPESAQSTVSRVFKPKKLLVQIRFRTIEKLLDRVLSKAQALGLTRLPPDKHYLSNLVCQLEVFVDSEVFDAATSEIMTQKNQSKTSIYACELRDYLSRQSSGNPP